MPEQQASSEAAIKEAEADVQNANLQLSYTNYPWRLYQAESERKLSKKDREFSRE